MRRWKVGMEPAGITLGLYFMTSVLFSCLRSSASTFLAMAWSILGFFLATIASAAATR